VIFFLFQNRILGGQIVGLVPFAKPKGTNSFKKSQKKERQPVSQQITAQT